MRSRVVVRSEDQLLRIEWAQRYGCEAGKGEPFDLIVELLCLHFVLEDLQLGPILPIDHSGRSTSKKLENPTARCLTRHELYIKTEYYGSLR